MKITPFRDGMFVIEANQDELLIIKGCINDATDLLGDNAFHARVGADKQEAFVIMSVIRGALNAAP